MLDVESEVNDTGHMIPSTPDCLILTQNSSISENPNLFSTPDFHPFLEHLKFFFAFGRPKNPSFFHTFNVQVSIIPVVAFSFLPKFLIVKGM